MIVVEIPSRRRIHIENPKILPNGRIEGYIDGNYTISDGGKRTLILRYSDRDLEEIKPYFDRLLTVMETRGVVEELLTTIPREHYLINNVHVLIPSATSPETIAKYVMRLKNPRIMRYPPLPEVRYLIYYSPPDVKKPFTINKYFLVPKQLAELLIDLEENLKEDLIIYTRF